MAFRFHRSLKLFPGVRLNISKRGLGISAGVRGVHVGVDSRGKGYTSAGIPGTGLSIRSYAKKGSPEQTHSQSERRTAAGALVGCGLVLFVLLLIVLAILR